MTPRVYTCDTLCVHCVYVTLVVHCQLRDRLRISTDRIAQLEEELGLAHQEVCLGINVVSSDRSSDGQFLNDR